MGNRRNKPKAKPTTRPLPHFVPRDNLGEPIRLEITAEEHLTTQARRSVTYRHNSHVSEQRVVIQGRSLGVSWDRLGDLLELPGETLRRRYAGVTEPR